MTFSAPQVAFFWVAFNDANRRNALMMRLTNSLEIDFFKKDHVSVVHNRKLVPKLIFFNKKIRKI